MILANITSLRQGRSIMMRKHRIISPQAMHHEKDREEIL